MKENIILSLERLKQRLAWPHPSRKHSFIGPETSQVPATSRTLPSAIPGAKSSHVGGSAVTHLATRTHFCQDPSVFLCWLFLYIFIKSSELPEEQSVMVTQKENARHTPINSHSKNHNNTEDGTQSLSKKKYAN